MREIFSSGNKLHASWFGEYEGHCKHTIQFHNVLRPPRISTDLSRQQ